MKLYKSVYSQVKGWWLIPFEYRHDPVPYTGGGYNYNYFRRMRTTQELRYLCDEDHYKYSRKRRKNLPNSWDDLYRKDYDDKSWKRHRRTQYKVKG